ncbi:larval cuticle protein 9-like [Teleopsis dalmanni]|uniref:larval cuticle protein 9-like n=1 Tax=Teleopsis dalmanni TaxID=139649 RepID=UPI000D32CCEE|nr:larval cuticle protein 9-like [Teleopsis dalmanni]
MKFVILFACLFALAFANEEANVLKNDAEVNPDSFKYAYEFDNHIKAVQEGILKDKDLWFVSGEYEYISPEGKTVKVSYVADDTGYHPKVFV